MAKFTKRILKPGKYLVTTPSGREEVVITKSRLEKWIADFGKMLANGLKVPAPWKHDKKAVPVADSDKSSSKNNAGFWEKLYLDEEGYLTGELDVPLDKDAEKVGTTVREVSPQVRPGWQDGLGNKYDEPILHIALVTNPIIPGQDNFKPSQKGELAIAMSHLIEMADDDDSQDSGSSGDGKNGAKFDDKNKDEGAAGDKPTTPNASSATVKDVLTVLAKLGLKLPDDTSAQNLVERIVVAGEAIAATQQVEEEEVDDTTVAEGKGKETPPPIAMSEEDSMPANLLSFAANKQKSEYKERISALIKDGKCSPAYAKANLTPLAEGFELSAELLDEEGNLVPQLLDIRLEALEAQTDNPLTKRQTAAKKSGKSLSMAREEEWPDDYEANEVSDEQADRLVDLQLVATGRMAPRAAHAAAD